MSIRTVIRLSKALLSLSVGLFAGLVVLNNLTDYWTNYHFVSHVLKMDTIPPESTTRKRAITASWLHHIAYVAIIAVEAAIAWLCTLGGLAMLRATQADSQRFHEAKRWSMAGLTGGLLLWFTGFQVLAGEWFGMWMSEKWNGLSSAARLTQVMSALLIFVGMKNDE